MKKPLLLFIALVLLLVIGKVIYNKYCESKGEDCKEEKLDDSHGLPEEGVDW